MILDILKVLLRPQLLRQAIKAVEWENRELLNALAEYEKDEVQTNLSWEENGMWYGWRYNPDKKRYYFNDVGYESLTDLWEDQSLMELESLF